jgi:carboxypeptidase Taq
MSHLRSVLHEAGHSFYEMGLPVEHFGTPLGEALSLGMHESQSRLFETQLGLSEPFWQFWYPKLASTFSGFKNIEYKQFLKGINSSHPSLIRIEADEVTYGLHIILRFEIEKGLIDGSIKVSDIPEIWREKMQHSLGIVPPDDQSGCLQDVHWAAGLFGYFPTYLLGSIWAAQLYHAWKCTNPTWKEQIESGRYDSLHDWLKDKIWQHGRRYSSETLLQKATGHTSSPDFFLDYLEAKYLHISLGQ